MTTEERHPILRRIKDFLIGKKRDLKDPNLFHQLSLIAFFAWVGLGADGLSSSSYGPAEIFHTLREHTSLAIFVAVATAITIFVISASYSQIIELFPSGGGGYLVASKLLSPEVGMISGCALVIDYVLTITISVASGVDAVFSFFPENWGALKMELGLIMIVLLIILNLRGVKESVTFLMPIFLMFVITHVALITYGIFSHAVDLPAVVAKTHAEVNASVSTLGLAGTLLLILKAYTMGAGTYTGIEAVSNGVPILREPKVATAKRTMRYMAWSLSFTVFGIILCYMLYDVRAFPGKTLNAVLFENIAKDWGQSGQILIVVTLVSEAFLLFIAAQAGFLDGPRVLSSMAVDRWFPTKLAMLSDRLVTLNGVMLMGGAALFMMILSHGSVHYLVVLYSINVFLTFSISQLGMVKHWWEERKTQDKLEHRKVVRGLLLNGIGLILTTFILISVVVMKFNEGGWMTLVITGSLIIVAILIRRHYNITRGELVRLDDLVTTVEKTLVTPPASAPSKPSFDPSTKTAVVLVNGFNGLGLHTLFAVLRLFKNQFKNFVFLQVGVLDAGNFKGSSEINALNQHIEVGLQKYVALMNRRGFYAEFAYRIGTDVVAEVSQLAEDASSKFPDNIFFGSQILFATDFLFSRVLHNNTIFAVQKELYYKGIPVVILPIRAEIEKTA